MTSLCDCRALPAGYRLVMSPTSGRPGSGGGPLGLRAAVRQGSLPRMSPTTDGDAEPGVGRALTLEAEVEAPPQALGRFGGVFESLRLRDFALFWSGALASNIGSWMQIYALSIVVYDLRHSSFDLGLVSFVSGVPVLVLALPAGAVADRVDRRRLLIGLQSLLLVQATALGVLYNVGRIGPHDPGGSLLLIAGLGIAGGACMALGAPAFQSMMPDLVPRRLLMNGIALNSAQFQSSRLLGPLAAAGLVLAGAGMGEIFYANAASFLFVIAALWAIRFRPRAAADEAAAPGGGGPGREGARQVSWHALTAGLRYARDDRAVGTLVLSTAIMTICSFPFMTLLPAIMGHWLGYSGRELSRVVAYVMAANGLGALAGALGVASLPHTARRDRLIPVALGLLGVLLAGLALSRWLWLTLALSTLAGAALMGSNSLTNTSLQAAAPGHLRGRVMSLYVLSFMGMMPISAIASGSLGQWIGPARAVLVGAVLLLAWTAVLMSRPQLLRGAGAEEEPRPQA